VKVYERARQAVAGELAEATGALAKSQRG
jgi:hypothetical protein